MKKRLMKTVLELCYEISTKTKADCFFWYAPHVDTFDIHLHREGWYEGSPKEEIAFCTKVTIENLKKAIADLNEVLAELQEVA